MKKSIALIILGCIWVLGFAPFNLWFIPPISLCGFFFLIVKATQVEDVYYSKKRSFLDGWLYGLGLFFGGVHWIYISIAEFGKGGPIAGVLVTVIFVMFLALYPAIFSLIVSRLLSNKLKDNKRNNLAIIFILPALWVLLEWLRGWLFTGFPWLLLGNAYIDTPLKSIAPIAGVHGISLVAALISALIVSLIISRTVLKSLLVLVVIILLPVTIFYVGQVNWTQKSGDPVKVAVIQGNIGQDIKWNSDYRQYTLDKYRDMSQPQFGKFDVIVWPETAIPDFLHYVDDYMLSLQQQVDTTGTSIVTGVPVYDHYSKRYYNSMISIDKEKVSYYAKRHLVIFGEYIPFRKLFGDSLDFLGAALADFTPGENLQKPLKTKAHKAAASVCFEIVFASEIARELGDADYLINISNDAWFEGSIAPYQHIQIARMRAAETNRPLIRATNTGISALIDADGSIIKQSPQFAEYVLTGTIQPRSGETPYVRWRNTPILVLMLALLIVGLLVRRIGREKNG